MFIRVTSETFQFTDLPLLFHLLSNYLIYTSDCTNSLHNLSTSIILPFTYSLLNTQTHPTFKLMFLKFLFPTSLATCSLRIYSLGYSKSSSLHHHHLDNLSSHLPIFIIYYLHIELLSSIIITVIIYLPV